MIWLSRPGDEIQPPGFSGYEDAFLDGLLMQIKQTMGVSKVIIRDVMQPWPPEDGLLDACFFLLPVPLAFLESLFFRTPERPDHWQAGLLMFKSSSIEGGHCVPR